MGVLGASPARVCLGPRVIPRGRLDAPRGREGGSSAQSVPPPGSVLPQGPCGSAQSDRGDLLIATEQNAGPTQRLTPGRPSTGEVSRPRRRAPQKSGRPADGVGGSRAAPQPPPSATLAGGGAGSGGGGGGARPARRPRPRPAPPVAAPPAPPAPPQPQSRRAAESKRRAPSAEPAGGANKAAAARAVQAPDAPSERPTGPLSRAGQERWRPRSAPSAACGARWGR